ncbi:Uncharacterised protein [Vibrio cholerae]|nr:Uncharacterised protein [Vibrio cholerae]
MLTFFTKTPFAEDGFAFFRATSRASKFSFSWSASNVTLPIVVWMIPFLSLR